MAFILHIDTSSNKGVVFLSQDNKVLSHTTIDDNRTQSAFINNAIEIVLNQNKISLNAMSAISVCNGPGSYTGLRVGLSTAKGICFALDKPLLLHNKLDLALAEYETDYQDFVIAFKARQDEFFTINSIDKKAQHSTKNELSDIVSFYKINTLITDDVSLNIENKTSKLIAEYAPKKEIWTNIAYQFLNNKKFDDIAYSEPFYLKKAYTTQPKKNKLNS